MNHDGIWAAIERLANSLAGLAEAHAAQLKSKESSSPTPGFGSDLRCGRTFDGDEGRILMCIAPEGHSGPHTVVHMSDRWKR